MMGNPYEMGPASEGLERLRQMVEEAGGQAAFARSWSRNPNESPIDPTYLSQLLSGHRSFGERARVRMARRCALPDDFFERSSVTLPDRSVGIQNSLGEPNVFENGYEISSAAREILRILRQLPVRAHVEVLGAARVIAAAHGIRTTSIDTSRDD